MNRLIDDKVSVFLQSEIPLHDQPNWKPEPKDFILLYFYRSTAFLLPNSLSLRVRWRQKKTKYVTLTAVVTWSSVFSPISIRQKGCIILLSYCSLVRGFRNHPPPTCRAARSLRKLESLLHELLWGRSDISRLTSLELGILMVWWTMVVFRRRVRFQGFNAIQYGYSHRYMHSVLLVSRYIELLSSKARFSWPGLLWYHGTVLRWFPVAFLKFLVGGQSVPPRCCVESSVMVLSTAQSNADGPNHWSRLGITRLHSNRVVGQLPFTGSQPCILVIWLFNTPLWKHPHKITMQIASYKKKLCTESEQRTALFYLCSH